MSKFIWLLVAFLALLLLLLGAVDNSSQSTSWEHIQREQIAVEQAQHNAELARHWSTVRAAAFNTAAVIGVYVLVAGVPIIVLAVLGVAVYKFFHRRHFVEPSGNGLLALPADDPRLFDAAAAALLARHETERQRAIASGNSVPHNFSPTISIHDHYAPSPHYSPQWKSEHVRAPGTAEISADAVAHDALPGITDLVTVAHQPTMQAILLGLGPGSTPVTVPLKDLWHIAMAGSTGSGKSNIARLIIPQLLVLKARVAIADPKFTEYDAESGEDWRPIVERLHLPPAFKATDIADLLRWHLDELEQRLERRQAGQRLGAPLFLYLDEWHIINADVKDADVMVGRLARSGRGLGIFLLTAAHDFLVKSGTGDAREQYRTTFYLGGDLKTGSVLLDLPQREVSQAEQQLATGMALLRSLATRPARPVRVPYASNAGITRLLTNDAPTMEGGGRYREGMSGAAETSKPQSTHDSHILRLLYQYGYTETVRKLSGGSTSGRKSDKARAEVDEVIRRSIAPQCGGSQS